jgi:hypothetical protein
MTGPRRLSHDSQGLTDFCSIGCTYNDPANYAAINGTFSSCKGEDQLPAGVYVDGNGNTMTYYQPAESLYVVSWLWSFSSSSGRGPITASLFWQRRPVLTTKADHYLHCGHPCSTSEA